MALSKKLLAGGLAAVALLATAGSAFAAPAYVTSNVNVRSGPGTGYAIVDALRRGEQVDVQQCRGSWCYVEKRGPDGWVSANYLERGGRPGWNDDYYQPAPPPPPVWNPRPPRPPVWGNPPPPPVWNNPRPPRPPVWGDPRPPRPFDDSSSVCFNGPNGYFCAGN
ncbi:MAG: SH3 domain-containing protein [Candidatus Devosia phytovorans]|uniref:SH3 domain-containing protein n=1 Tax=Candidatus Devosia phytovorans TaxID=3121372 RepID=A0AAJ5VWS2_9HYPH|nr:SH3 domain-containing protein [Devosia sp.]WEK05355.1 MAG: SH3 domain-containing protein [Devosia sp.]